MSVKPLADRVLVPNPLKPKTTSAASFFLAAKKLNKSVVR